MILHLSRKNGFSFLVSCSFDGPIMTTGLDVRREVQQFRLHHDFMLLKSQDINIEQSKVSPETNGAGIQAVRISFSLDVKLKLSSRFLFFFLRLFSLCVARSLTRSCSRLTRGKIALSRRSHSAKSKKRSFFAYVSSKSKI